MHQIKKQLSRPNLHRHHIQGDVLQSITTAIHQAPSPIKFCKVKSHTGIIGNKYADTLARKSITTNSDVADTSILKTGPEGDPVYSIYWLVKKIIIKSLTNAKITQARVSHLPKGFGTYPITMTPCKHTCPLCPQLDSALHILSGCQHAKGDIPDLQSH
jgi:hypothetical protein